MVSERERGGEHRADELPSLLPAALGEGEKLKVVATTSIVGDVVQKVGEDLIELENLMPAGTDPHSFEPTPRDIAAVADAHVVFANGLGLEAFLDPLLESAGAADKVVYVSHGIELIVLAKEDEQEKDGEEHEEGDGDLDHEETDPHTWLDPSNVVVWVRNIAHALSALDPAHAEVYAAHAEAYEVELEKLDAWIRAQLAQVPDENRKLVTDHATFGYFVRRYGFEQIGTVFPGHSTLAEPSAKDLAALEDAIREFDVKAIFVGLSVRPGLAERVAEDTGTRLVHLYTGSLSEAGGPAEDYLSLMRYDVCAIAEALR